MFNPKNYSYSKTGVEFQTADRELKKLFDKAEELCRKNRANFDGYEVLIEGEKYTGVWLETQPMGGEMYAKRDIGAALSNILIFLRNQRRDGKLPGMITFDPCNKSKVFYAWMQGCFLPNPALNLYYLAGEESEYLSALYRALEDYDGYLWKYRDSDGDGCLETWCVWDTGEDNFTVYILNGARESRIGGYGDVVPPDEGGFPYESPQYMSYSYACRRVLAEISAILGNGKTEEWKDKADKLKKTFRKYLWDEERKACFMRDANNNFIDCLSQENIKCMYGGIFDQQMADSFISEHLLNTEEFWTPYPIPSVAVNSGYFHSSEDYSNCYDKLKELGMAEGNINVNSWSGPVNGLTLQRTIGALLNYDHHAETVLVGKKLENLLKKNGVFVQNYNPFTGEKHGESDGYGPTMLAFLEYVSLMYGVNISRHEVLWTGTDGGDYEYTQQMFGHSFTVKHTGEMNTSIIDGKMKFKFSENVRVKTDLDGNIQFIFGISAEKEKMSIFYKGEEYEALIKPNEIAVIDGGIIRSVKKIDFKEDMK